MMRRLPGRAAILAVALAALALAGCGGGDDDDDSHGQIDAADGEHMMGDEIDAALPPDASPLPDASPPPDAAPPDAPLPAIVVEPTSGLMTSESGTTAEFAIRLTTQPAFSVGFTLTNPDPTEISVAPTFIVWGVDNWDTVVVVTVTGVPDGIVDGDQMVTIGVPPATSADPDYGGFDAPDPTVTNVDID